MTSLLLLFCQTHPEGAKRPWRIAETTFTIEGPRTRFTDFVFATQQEALAKMEELEEARRPS